MKIIKIISPLIPKKLKNNIYTFLIQLRSSKIKIEERSDALVASSYLHHISNENELEVLGNKYQPTKRLHNYLPHYWKHFRDIRHQVTKVLEIGIQSDRSIKMWEEFFPNAEIYGIDIEPDCLAFAGNRRKIFIGNQIDETFLNNVLKEAGGAFDIIIDDGSHRVYHQLKSFNILFPKLKSHGIYVIEDTGACVGDTQLKTIKQIKKLVDKIMYFPKGLSFDKWSSLESFDSRADWESKNIVGISFHRWICFIERGRNPEDNKYIGNDIEINNQKK